MAVSKTKAILGNLFKQPSVEQIENPLKLQIGSQLSIKDIDYDGLIFKVKKIISYTREINGKNFVFIDYELDKQSIKLRYNPLIDSNGDGRTHNVLILKMYEEMAYNEDFHNLLKDTTKIFEVLEADVVQERYFRINDVQDSYKAVVNVISDNSSKEFEKSSIEYWDYYREIKDEAGLPLVQYLFIEMDSACGWFQIWRGSEIDSQQILF